MKKLCFASWGRIGLLALPQVPFSILYKGCCVGECFADIVVEGALVVEVECVERLGNEQTAQCSNYFEGFGDGALFVG